jgi:hypothetical protein
MTESKAIDDLKATLNLLRDYIESYHQGKQYHYLGIAVQLRKLCCDTQRGAENSLLPKVLQGLTWHPIYESDSKWLNELRTRESDPKARLILASPVVFSTGSPGVHSVVDETLSPISLSPWLDQVIYYGETIDGTCGEVTIRELIRSTADKEGAHSDEDYNDTLRVVRGAFTNSQFHGQEMIYISMLVRLGEYVLRRTAAYMKEESDRIAEEQIKRDSSLRSE